MKTDSCSESKLLFIHSSCIFLGGSFFVVVVVVVRRFIMVF